MTTPSPACAGCKWYAQGHAQDAMLHLLHRHSIWQLSVVPSSPPRTITGPQPTTACSYRVCNDDNAKLFRTTMYDVYVDNVHCVQPLHITMCIFLTLVPPPLPLLQAPALSRHRPPH